jgi:hypothetical protein
MPGQLLPLAVFRRDDIQIAFRHAQTKYLYIDKQLAGIR